MAVDGKGPAAGSDRPRPRPPSPVRPSPRLLVPLLFVTLFRVSDVVRFSHSSDYYSGASVLEDWVVGGLSPDRVKSLVVTQLPPVKSEHYRTYLGPSWRKLLEDRRKESYDMSAERVQADLFIACTQQSCDQIDRQNCNLLNVTGDAYVDKLAWTQMLEHNRAPGEILCYFAPVPEKPNEAYKFAHSLNFLEMEPFVSLMELGYYEYVLRTDADAILFPGLLHVRPTGSGLVGHGWYGADVTPHLVRHFAKKLLPELGEPYREAANATPPMQSTFYVRADLVSKFASTLLNATRILREKAFDHKGQNKGICNELEKMEVVQEFKQSYLMANGRMPNVGPKGSWVCLWPFWFKGVASLYGTRIAVDYVLPNVTVTNALDALSTHFSFGDQPMANVIQCHVMALKLSIDEYFQPPNAAIPDSIICVAPNETVHASRSRILEKGELGPGDPMLGILDAMETVAYAPASVPSTMYHRIAEILLHHHREKQGCGWPFREGGFEVLGEGGANVSVTWDSYNETLKEIPLTRELAERLGKQMTELEEEARRLKEELHGLKMGLDELGSREPELAALSRRWCGRCLWHEDVTYCNKRRDHLTKNYHMSMVNAMTELMEDDPLCVLRPNVTNWCGHCKLETTTCNWRKEFLMSRHKMTPQEAVSFLVELEPACVGRNVTKSKWCGDCSWKGDVTCDERRNFMVKRYKNLNTTEVEMELMEKSPFCALGKNGKKR